MTDTQAQEAASLAEWLEGVSEAISAREAAALLRSQAARIAELEKAIERMTNNRDMWKGQCERQAAELARMREPLSDDAAYKRGYRDGYEWRHAEVLGALA